VDTLVLSFSYTPLARVSCFRAFKMVLTGRAEILEEYSDRVICSFSTSWPVPSIIRFVRKATGYFHRSIAFSRKNVWLRDKGKCQYCDVDVTIREFTFDHVVPLSQGGNTTWENIVVACPKCNQKKMNRTPQQAKMKLLSQPMRPKFLPTTDLALSVKDIPETWRDYLGAI